MAEQTLAAPPLGQGPTRATVFSYDVFVSYAPANRDWVARQLLPQLQGAGLKVVIDFANFEVGVPILENIEAAIVRSRRTLLVLTPAWVDSRWTELEGLLVMYLGLESGR